MEYKFLRELYLNPTAIACYESLCENGPATVTKLAMRISKHRTSVDRELKKLVLRGFVSTLQEHVGPSYYFAVPIEKALLDLSNYYFKAVLPIILHQRSKTAAKKHSRRWL